MKAEYFYELIEGKRKGPSATALRALLTCISVPYSWVMRLRNFLYEKGVFRSSSVGVPVISVGNLTLGGTGKTPMVAYLTKWCLDRKLRPGLVSRGYGKNAHGKKCNELNDEGKELQLRFPSVPHEQSPDRVSASLSLLSKNKRDLIILDDAFQNRKITRDLDIVLLDALDPFGLNRVFPRGTLREPLDSLARSGIVLLSRSDLVSQSKRQEVRDRVKQIAPNVVWGEIAHKPSRLVSFYEVNGISVNSSNSSSELGVVNATSESGVFSAEQSCSINWLENKKVVAFCGIGRPVAFRKTLDNCGAEVAEFATFADHYEYTEADLKGIADIAEKNRAKAIICTLKDAVKIRKQNLSGFPLWAVMVEVEFLAGEQEFGKKLEEILLNKIS
ncbi:MAG: tetraacyldisaccharide 4'-kinase [Thermoguttaceae bacterium]